MNQTFIHLASGSPRRLALLGQLGVACRVHAVDIDENPLQGEPASDYVCRMARDKAAAAVTGLGSDVTVLAADTTVVIDDEPLGKPRDREHALQMLSRLSGRCHEVMTAVATRRGEKVQLALSTTTVRFRTINARERAAYWHTGEPVDKAGGYAIQGKGAVFVEHIDGSYSGVMGLPLFETAQLLQAAGIDPLAS